MNKKKYNAYLMLITSMLIWGSIGIMRRNIGQSSAFIAMMRGLLGGTCLLVYTCIKNGKGSIKASKKDFFFFSLTGIAMGINWMLLFESYEYTTVANATISYYMMPIIIIFLTPVIFKKRISANKLLCAFTGLIGMGFISGINGNQLGKQDLIGIILGLSAATLYAFVVILNKLNETDNIYTRTIIQLLSAGFVLLPYLYLSGEFQSVSFSCSDMILIIILGTIHTGAAYLLYFSSLKILDAQSAAIISYIDPVFALIISVLLLSEPISPSGILGSVLILSSALLSELPVRSNGK